MLFDSARRSQYGLLLLGKRAWTGCDLEEEKKMNFTNADRGWSFESKTKSQIKAVDALLIDPA